MLIPPPPSERLLKPVILEEAPQQSVWQQPALPLYEPEIPSASPPRVRRQVPVRTKKETESAKPLVAGPKPIAPGFRLGEVLTQAQKAEMNFQTDSFLAAADQAVRTASSQPMTVDQKGLVDQVHSLILQSKRARELDLGESRKLAERAKTLADALLRSLGN